jgi:hypothetical protein
MCNKTVWVTKKGMQKTRKDYIRPFKLYFVTNEKRKVINAGNTKLFGERGFLEAM